LRSKKQETRLILHEHDDDNDDDDDVFDSNTHTVTSISNIKLRTLFFKLLKEYRRDVYNITLLGTPKEW
jgi:23S rRNA maturation-related 3'-5' exoribonuclease YhaM